MRHQIMSASSEEPLFEIDEPDYVSPKYDAHIATQEDGGYIDLYCSADHCLWEVEFLSGNVTLTQMQEVFSEHVNDVHLRLVEEATDTDLPQDEADLVLERPRHTVSASERR